MPSSFIGIRGTGTRTLHWAQGHPGRSTILVEFKWRIQNRCDCRAAMKKPTQLFFCFQGWSRCRKRQLGYPGGSLQRELCCCHNSEEEVTTERSYIWGESCSVIPRLPQCSVIGSLLLPSRDVWDWVTTQVVLDMLGIPLLQLHRISWSIQQCLLYTQALPPTLPWRWCDGYTEVSLLLCVFITNTSIQS